MSLLLLPTTDELSPVLVKAGWGWGGVSILCCCCVSGLVENWISPHLRQNPATWPHFEPSDQSHGQLCWHKQNVPKNRWPPANEWQPFHKKVSLPTKSSPKLITLVFLHISVTVAVAMEAASPVISFISVVNLPVNRGRVLARCYQTTPCDGGPSKARQQWCVIMTRAAMTSPRKQNEILTIWMAFYPSSLHLILHELPTQTPDLSSSSRLHSSSHLLSILRWTNLHIMAVSWVGWS